jgi:hypothetical protein
MSVPRTIRLSPEDNVIVAVDQIVSGAEVAGLTAREHVPLGVCSENIIPDVVRQTKLAPGGQGNWIRILAGYGTWWEAIRSQRFV